MKYKYIHDIDSIACNKGELYLTYDNETLVFNTDTLYKDLHIIINMVCKENKKQQEQTLQDIKESLNNI